MVAIKALACEFPATADPPQPLARWQCPDLARAAVESGIVAAISGTTIWRWLSSDAIRLTRSLNRVRSGTLCRCSSSDAPGLNSPRPGNV